MTIGKEEIYKKRIIRKVEQLLDIEEQAWKNYRADETGTGNQARK